MRKHTVETIHGKRTFVKDQTLKAEHYEEWKRWVALGQKSLAEELEKELNESSG